MIEILFAFYHCLSQDSGLYYTTFSASSISYLLSFIGKRTAQLRDKIAR